MCKETLHQSYFSGQVGATAIDETGDLSAVVKRLHGKGVHLKAIFVDNCYTIWSKQQEYFGSQISVKLDLFHAIQQFLSIKHPLYYQILKDVKLIVRDPKYTGEECTLSTPSPKVLCERLDSFLESKMNIKVIRLTVQ